MTATAIAIAMLVAACKDSRSASDAAITVPDAGAGNPDAAEQCPPCVADNDCPSGQVCAQFGGDSWCAPTCASGAGCAGDRTCTQLTSGSGEQVEACVPITDVCGTTPPPPSDAATDDSGPPAICGAMVGPDIAACCHSCRSRPDCAPNGCYGGWYCNTEICRCQSPPDPATCTEGPDAGARPDAAERPDGTPGVDGAITPTGGMLDTLHFAIVGDTRPPSNDDTAGYPTSIITEIYQGIDAEDPRPPFVVGTGDYMFASTRGNESNTQLDLYLGARAYYSNILFPALGNHECTGATASNCGPGTASGNTRNFDAFMTRMLGPLGKTTPYYSFRVDATDQSWSAKFVFVAGNAWTDDQGTWLESALSEETTYTFLIRHEPRAATTAPGTTPSEEIIDRHPLTLRIVGHTHTLSYSAFNRQLIVGNGGAPLSSSANYGYVIAKQRASDMAIEFSAIDYSTHGVFANFAVLPDGTFVQ